MTHTIELNGPNSVRMVVGLLMNGWSAECLTERIIKVSSPPEIVRLLPRLVVKEAVNLT